MARQVFSALLLGSMLLLSHSVMAKGTDVNGDGVFSKDEVLQARQKQLDKKFVKFDQNQDGQITMNELEGKRGGLAKKADVNKDGVITTAEAREHMNKNVDKYFSKKDTNSDGVLDQQERKRVKKAADAVKKPKKAKKTKAM